MLPNSGTSSFLERPGGLVGDVRQAPPSPLIGRAPRACTACLRLRSGAQLVNLRRDQDQGAQQDVACDRRQARLLPRGPPHEVQAPGGRLQAGGGKVVL